MLSRDDVVYHDPLMKQVVDCIGDSVAHLLFQ